jgi:beta-galactosidase
MLALAGPTLQHLLAAAQAGVRVVLDMPSGWYDDFGRLLNTNTGSTFEQLFGCSIRDFQYASNIDWTLQGRPMRGFTADLGVTTAEVAATFDQGPPAVTVHQVGDGAGVVLAYEAALQCYRPGNDAAENDLTAWALGQQQAPFSCTGALAYRLASPQADHYFLINDGPATKAVLDIGRFEYAEALDVIEEDTVDASQPIAIDAYSARWLRLAKSNVKLTG